MHEVQEEEEEEEEATASSPLTHFTMVIPIMTSVFFIYPKLLFLILRINLTRTTLHICFIGFSICSHDPLTSTIHFQW